MRFEVGVVNEIECRPDNTDEAWFRGTKKDTQEHLLHILVFSSSPLGDQRDAFFEMS